MKIPLSTFFFLATIQLFSQYLPDTTASRLKISKVIRNMKDPNSQTIFTDYYDKTGKVVKSESLDKSSNENATTTYKYENGVIINETFKSYYNGKLLYWQTTISDMTRTKK